MRAREPVARLGEREQDVLALIADGARNPDVASVLQLSPMKSHPEGAIPMQLSVTPQQQRDYVASNQPVVQAKVDEPVLAWSIFVRAGSYGAMAAGYLSPVVVTVIKLVAKKRAAGLPARFLLVVTPTKVRAFKFSQRRAGLRVGDELAVWDRAQLSVSTKETALTMRVTLASAADGEQVVCDTGKGEFTDAFLRTIGAAPAASNPALWLEAA